MAPTDRSSPPVTMTAIMARPIIVSIPIWRPMVKRLNVEMNPCSVLAKTANSSKSRTANPNSLLKTVRIKAESRPAAGAGASRLMSALARVWFMIVCALNMPKNVAAVTRTAAGSATGRKRELYLQFR